MLVWGGSFGKYVVTLGANIVENRGEIAGNRHGVAGIREPIRRVWAVNSSTMQDPGEGMNSAIIH